MAKAIEPTQGMSNDDTLPLDVGTNTEPNEAQTIGEDASTTPLEKEQPEAPTETMKEPEKQQINDMATKRAELLQKIEDFEKRGAILPNDAHTLRFQVHESTSGQWRAVEVRLQRLACSWNPYQDQQQQPPNVSTTTSPEQQTRKKPRRNKMKEKVDKKKQNFYALLELTDPANASAEDIKRQFRKLALLLHPDKRMQGGATVLTNYDDVEQESEPDSTEFARLRLAYETLSDPVKRASYDAKLASQRGEDEDDEVGFQVKNQMKLEATTDFASLEWMARVKHKMDVMDRIAEWAKLLQINATEIRFETGEPCVGRGCGKIVTMDRDLECYGSPRRRVYVCLLHKYVHACDERCTSHYEDSVLDKHVCPMRAYWLVQSWIYDQLQVAAQKKKHSIKEKDETKEEQEQKEEKEEQESNQECMLVESEIHLGDHLTSFHIGKAAECQSRMCTTNFQFLEDGIYACKRHGTPHICTYEQCDQKQLRQGRYVCWISSHIYGGQREEAGTGVRTRQVVYTDAHGEENSIEMEVPVMLPLGQMAGYLLEGNQRDNNHPSSLSPPPPDEKMWNSKRSRCEDDVSGYDSDTMVPQPTTKRTKVETETSPVRARIRRRLTEKVQQSESSSFYVYLKVPSAVASLPKVALELQDPGEPDDEMNASQRDMLPIRVLANHTVNYIKYWMEELTDQQISIWDQQIYWGDTLIGEETNVMVLEEHGITAGCVLELRLHDDCPLLMAAWNDQNAAGASVPTATTLEYNTVQISKEAEEDLDDRQEEWENVIAVEEEAFRRRRLERKREKMEQSGALNHTEVIKYDGRVPLLMGVLPITGPEKKLLQLSQTGKVRMFPLKRPTEVSKEVTALKGIADEAQPTKVKRPIKKRSKPLSTNVEG